MLRTSFGIFGFQFVRIIGFAQFPMYGRGLCCKKCQTHYGPRSVLALFPVHICACGGCVTHIASKKRDFTWAASKLIDDVFHDCLCPTMKD